MIYVGNNEISNIYIGADEIYGIYAGDLQIYPTDYGNVTGITLSGLTWVTDVPYTGGTADSGNCSFKVVAFYDSGKSRNVTSQSTISGSLVVPETTATTREMVGTLTLTASYSGFTASDSVDAYQKAVSIYVWVDIRTIDNNTPFYDVGWKTNGSFSGDMWFAELSGLTTDSGTWNGGTAESAGYYTYHRFNSNQYTCTFTSRGRVGYGAKIEYGISVEDEQRSNLPTETINGNTYYVLGISNWEDWKPLYVPYSTSRILSNWSEGLIMVKILV